MKESLGDNLEQFLNVLQFMDPISGQNFIWGFNEDKIRMFKNSFKKRDISY